MSQIDREAFERLMNSELPFAVYMGLRVQHISTDRVAMLAPFQAGSLRPGGTISGPAMMGLADASLYLLVLAQIGLEPLAVTTNLNINFLRKPEPTDLIGEARPLKVGRRLVVGEVNIFSSADPKRIFAHVTGTYSVPPQPE